jgi:hypothetical protein
MKEKIEHALNEALDTLLKRDAHILKADANERTISHRLAGYLEPYFDGWNVDCDLRPFQSIPRFIIRDLPCCQVLFHGNVCIPINIIGVIGSIYFEVKNSFDWLILPINHFP